MATTTRPKKAGAAFRRPVGAPPAIDEIVTYDADGEPVTAAERIVRAIRAGSYVETAAAAANVDKTTLYDWLKKGAAANTKRSKGRRLTPSEKMYSEFANGVAQAEADAEVDDVANLARVARGGFDVEVVTTKTNVDGKVETVERTEKALPNVAALTWRLERRFPTRWGRRGQLEITGADGGPIKVESPLATVMGELDAMERRQVDALAALEEAARVAEQVTEPEEESSDAP